MALVLEMKNGIRCRSSELQGNHINRSLACNPNLKVQLTVTWLMQYSRISINFVAVDAALITWFLMFLYYALVNYWMSERYTQKWE